MISLVQSVIAPGAGISQSIYYSANIAGSTGNVVTVTFNKATSSPQVGITEFSHVVATQSVDTTATATGSGTIALVDIQTIYPTTLLIGSFATTAIGSGTEGGWTNLYNTGAVVTEYTVLNAAESTGVALDVYPSASWIGQIVSFKTTATPVALATNYTAPGTVTATVPTTVPTQISGSCSIVTIYWGDASAGIVSVSDTSGNVYHPALQTESLPSPEFTQSVSMTNATNVGDLMVVTGTLPSTTIPNITVTDTLNTVYAQFGVTLTVYPGTAMWLFYGIVNTTGSNTVTVSYSTIQSGPTVTVMEWHSPSGWSGTTDGYAMRANPFGFDITTNPILTTNSDDLLIVTILNVAGATITPSGSSSMISRQGAAWDSTSATWGSVVFAWDSLTTVLPSSYNWNTFLVSADLTIAWQETSSAGTYSFLGEQNASGPWAAVIWAFSASLSVTSPPVSFIVTTSYLTGTTFKEVYPNRIPELIYDSLTNTPTFVFNPFGPSYGT